MLLKPIISDASNEILREAGVLSKREDGNRLREILDSNGLSLEETIAELSVLAKGSQDESIKLRSLDSALKMHGAMKDEEASKIPQIIINVVSSGEKNQGRTINGIASILLPREIPSQAEV